VKPAALALTVVLLACPGEGKPPSPPPQTLVLAQSPTKPVVTDITAEDYPMPRLPRAKVTLTGSAGRKFSIEAEVASTRDSRTRGLMWRYTLADGAGMLFIFNREQPLSFWMRNTLIPLDMIFIDAKGKIVSIIENAEPRTLSPRPSAAPATFVLEVPGGSCARSGVKAGASVTFEGIANIVAQD
jgi:uncharacterized protein